MAVFSRYREVGFTPLTGEIPHLWDEQWRAQCPSLYHPRTINHDKWFETGKNSGVMVLMLGAALVIQL